MAGRWVLASPGAGHCGMNFAGAAGAREGTIAPEGGCPGRFFTSRRWALEQNAVIIRNHAGEMLAQLNVAEPTPARRSGRERRAGVADAVAHDPEMAAARH